MEWRLKNYGTVLKNCGILQILHVGPFEAAGRVLSAE
jgi:hypothetical protein